LKRLHLKQLLFAMFLLSLAPWLIAAAPTPLPTRPAVGDPTPFPAVKGIFNDRTLKIEKDLAGKLMHRPEAPGATAPWVDLQIDLRMIERSFVAIAAEAKAESDLQIVALLRANELTAVEAQIDAMIQSGKNTLTRSRTDAAAKIRAISFDAASIKTVADLDQQCRQLGYALENVLNESPIDIRTVPTMRPALSLVDSETPGAAPADRAKTVAELSADITRSAISTSLRQQLLSLAKLATASAAAAATDPAQHTEAAAMQQMLAAGVDLSRGLTTITSLSPEVRTEIENKLAEGLALFSDPRTRAAGRDRVVALGEYRNVMNRLASGKLSAALRKSLAPALATIESHTAMGLKLLNSIDAYLGVCQQFDAAPRRENPVANLRRATEDAVKQFDTARQGFITVVNDPAVTPESADAVVADLRAQLELISMLDGMQGTYDALNTYKPRPFGTIEQRTFKASLAATIAVKSPSRTDAIRYLTDLTRLGQLSSAATVRSLSDVPPAIVKSYAGVSLTEFEAKCRLMMTEMVSQLAAGADMDKTRLARLRAVGELCAALRFAALAERSLVQMPALNRWADWAVSPDQARAMLIPYQQQLQATFAAFINDTSGTVEKFLETRGQYLPVIALLHRDAGYVEVCAQFPDGLAGAAARLMTPMENQPFATERYISYAAAISAMLADVDSDDASTVDDLALARLRRDLGNAVRDLPLSIATTKPAKSK
jgi:hypothetical protein